MYPSAPQLRGEIKYVIMAMVNYQLSGGTIGNIDVGHIIPLQKCHSRTRPIALMNFIRKCAEARVAHRTTELLNEFKLLNPSQYGGCPQPIFVRNSLMERASKK